MVEITQQVENMKHDVCLCLCHKAWAFGYGVTEYYWYEMENIYFSE